jgi:hypothetical protein
VKTVSIIIYLCTLGAVASAQPGADIFFFKDAAHGQWCAFKSESEWRAEMGLIPPKIVGGIEYKDNRVSVVHVSEVDETADWRVYDSYTVTKDGKLDSLKRQITIPSESVNDEEVWVIRNGRATKQGGKTNTDSRGVLLNIPVVTSVQSFPFWPLSGKLQEIREKGKVCIPDK